MNWLNNRNHLQYFLTVSQEGSAIKAAEKRHGTPAYHQHQLRDLEKSLVAKLFRNAVAA